MEEHVDRRTVRRIERVTCQSGADDAVLATREHQMPPGRSEEGHSCDDGLTALCLHDRDPRYLIELLGIHLCVANGHVKHHRDRNREVSREQWYDGFECLRTPSGRPDDENVD